MLAPAFRWALGSAEEHRLYTAGVIGSNPIAPTKESHQCCQRGRRSIGWIVALSRRRLLVRAPSSPLTASLVETYADNITGNFFGCASGRYGVSSDLQLRTSGSRSAIIWLEGRKWHNSGV